MILIEDKTFSEQNYFYICNPKKGYRGRVARQWSATPSTAVRIHRYLKKIAPFFTAVGLYIFCSNQIFMKKFFVLFLIFFSVYSTELISQCSYNLLNLKI